MGCIVQLSDIHFGAEHEAAVAAATAYCQAEQPDLVLITGDITQIDLPRHVKSGLKDAREKLAAIDGIYFHVFTSEDVVRHPLVQKIVDAYDAADADTTA